MGRHLRPRRRRHPRHPTSWIHAFLARAKRWSSYTGGSARARRRGRNSREERLLVTSAARRGGSGERRYISRRDKLRKLDGISIRGTHAAGVSDGSRLTAPSHIFFSPGRFSTLRAGDPPPGDAKREGAPCPSLWIFRERGAFMKVRGSNFFRLAIVNLSAMRES